MTKTYASLFSGCGGADLGLKNAGYKAEYAVEWNKGALDILTANHQINHVFHDDVCNVDYSELPEVDLLWASPSCQNYSLANPKRGETAEDKRSAIAICVAAQYAKTVVIENVPSYFKGEIFSFIKNQLISLGLTNYYGFCSNAADYGNPASRERVYYIFQEKPIATFFFEKSQTSWKTELKNHKHLWVESKLTDAQKTSVQSLLSTCYSGEMLAIERCGYYNRKPKVYKSSSQYPCIKSCSHHDGKKVKPGYGKIGCYRSYMDFIYKGQSYSVTPQLLGILNGFPVDFDWGENKAQAAAAIGNAVVPRMAELIAKNLIQSAE